MLGDMHTTMIRFCHAGLGIRSSPRGKPLPWFLHIWMWMKNCSGWQHDLPSLKLTVRPWKGNDHLPTIHFQVRLLLVSGRVYLHVLNSRMLSNIFLQNMYEKCHVFFFVWPWEVSERYLLEAESWLRHWKIWRPMVKWDHESIWIYVRNTKYVIYIYISHYVTNT